MYSGNSIIYSILICTNNRDSQVVFSAVYKRGGAPRKPTIVGEIINGVEKYAKQCHFIRDEESGNIFVRELSNNDIEYLDARKPEGGEWGKVINKVKGLAQRCQFIRDDETNEVYVRADFDDAEILNARESEQTKALLGKVIKGAKGLAQRCHFMRDVEEEMELLSRDPTTAFGAALKTVTGLAYRCHFMRDNSDDLN